MNPFEMLLKSRKFWLLMLDLVVSISSYFVAKYSSPEAAKDVMFLIGSLQPVFAVIIAAIASEDNAARVATTAALQSKNDVVIAQAYTEAKSAAE